MNAGPPRRLVVRIAAGIAFVLAVYLYVLHVEGRDRSQAEAAKHALALLNAGKPARALADAVEAQLTFGDTPEIARATWAALMSDGGRHGSAALLRRTFSYTPNDAADFSLAFSSDGRFLAAIDGTSIAVWNVQDGTQVATATAGDRFVGFFRIGSRYFGLLASYQYYDLVSAVIALPEGYRYAQPSKDALTAVAPGGDWAYQVPKLAPGLESPIKLINLHTGEKREVDIRYNKDAGVAVNHDATRIADEMRVFDFSEYGLWNARKRNQIARLPGMGGQLYFSDALGALVVAYKVEVKNQKRILDLFDADSGRPLCFISAPSSGANGVADDPNGQWFAVQTGSSIHLYRGANWPYLATVAAQEVSPAPATSR